MLSHLDDVAKHLARASERLKAAGAASGIVRQGHTAYAAKHLQGTLNAGHQLAASLRQHHPEIGAELDATTKAIGLARALSPEAMHATAAHLTGTILHEAGHALRHAQALMAPGSSDALWSFNERHAAKHLRGAAEHAVKLRAHLRDNYQLPAA